MPLQWLDYYSPVICFGEGLEVWGTDFKDNLSLSSPDCPGIHYINQACCEFKRSSASASGVLGLKMCTTTPGLW